jgi:hypothetical protein
MILFKVPGSDFIFDLKLFETTSICRRLFGNLPNIFLLVVLPHTPSMKRVNLNLSYNIDFLPSLIDSEESLRDDSKYRYLKWVQ